MSEIKIIGHNPKCERKIVGCYSLDQAFINDKGELGVPIGVGYELFGANHIGKSTFAYSLAGMLAEKGIILSDLEGFDEPFLRQVLQTVQFSGTVNSLYEDDDEDQLDELIKLLRTDEYSVAILDSIGAISPISEQEGDLGEANMGRRAKVMAQFTRKGLHLFRKTQGNTILATNHWYPQIGKRGYQSPGGEVKNFLFSVRILLKRKHNFPDGSYIMEGKVYKNRWGEKDHLFYIFMLSGHGLHKGLTALWDGMLLGKLDWNADLRKAVKLGDKSYGKLQTLVQEAKQGNTELFDPFLEVVNGNPEERADTQSTIEDN